MNDEAFLRRAIESASESKESVPCGVVLVRDDKIIAEACNSQRADKQATNHAEIKALQIANRRLKSRTLPGAIAYCSCEPCVMCLTALSLAKVARVVFAQTMKQVAPGDSLSQLDAQLFVEQYLGGIPQLEQLVVS